ncbi:MAG: hypothetical protein HZB29_07335 [Nitrospinae bacterium]|nr:hypothetical protein [Nitrospinota bacterium]
MNTVTVPPKLRKEFSSALRKGRYENEVDFFVDLLRLWKENQLFSELAASRKEIAAGKGKVLKSLKSLR